MYILFHLCLIAIESPFDILMYTVEKMWWNAKLHYVTKINIFNFNIGSKLKDLTNKKMSAEVEVFFMKKVQNRITI